MNLFKHFHLVAEYNDVGGYTFWNAGGGWHGLFGEKADLFAQVMWANVEVEAGRRPSGSSAGCATASDL